MLAGSGNDEFYTPYYAILPLLKYIKKSSTIWCPFDKGSSNFVQIFEREGYIVKATHIDNGEDFFNLDIDCDYIISNPPYSLKGEVFKRLFLLGKPFAMLVGVVGLFEGERYNIFSQHNFEMMYFDRRISYYSNEACKELSNPPFSSVYVCSNILPKQIVFECLPKVKSNTRSLF